MQYRDRAPFLFGTVVLPLHATQREVEVALVASFLETMPVGMAPPDQAIPIAGNLFFAPEESE
jgi:hypothetical protein